MKLNPWLLSGMLTITRTFGQIGLRHNGTCVDIWIRVNGKPCWFGISRRELVDFLSDTDHGREMVLSTESDGNAEETLSEAMQREGNE